MIKEFTITFSRTVNLGNYESARVEASLAVATDDHEFDEAKIAAQRDLRDLLEETWKAQYRKGNDHDK